MIIRPTRASVEGATGLRRLGRLGGGPVGRLVLAAALLLVAAAVLVIARIHRYQYLSVVGPSWHGNGTETDTVRIDRWTGIPQVWVCQEADTDQVANVPPPPRELRATDATAATVDAAATHSAYLIALARWRSDHPTVNPETMRVMRTRCSWQRAR